LLAVVRENPFVTVLPARMRRGADIVGAAVLTFVGIAIARATTPAITFGDGLGFLDGLTYAAMVTVLRTGEHIDLLSPYVYRILPIAAVAVSPLSLRTSFLLLNMLAFSAAGAALYVLARRYSPSPIVALLAVAWWVVLPAGIRLSVYYPVLIDGIGFLFLVALTLAAVQRNAPAFALLLPLGLLTRENLVVLIPFLFLSLRERGLVRAFVLTSLAAMPGLIALATVRIAPPIVPANDFSTFDDIVRNWGWFAQNAAERAWRFAAAPPLTLGFLLLVPLFRLADTLAFLRQHPAWLYYAAVTLAIQPIGGGDFDRFAFWLSPLLVVLTVQGASPPTARILVLLTPLQLLVARVTWTFGPDEAGFRSYNVATMSLEQLGVLVAYVALLAVLGGAVFWAGRGWRAQSVSRVASAPE
jgi:hypothetical protein